ncbi:MAG: histidine kinase N-terminal 7TM domain-containing protein [Halioglobus sp.]
MQPDASIAFFISCILFLALAVYAFRRPQVPGCRVLTAIMLACAWWIFCYAMDLRSTDPQERFVWTKLKYIGSVPAGFLWLSLVVELTGKSSWLRTWWYQALWLPAILLLLSVFTNEYHQLFWQSIEIKPGETHSGRAKGPAFYAYVLFTTLFAITSIGLTVYHSIVSVSFYRKRNVWLLLSFLCPFSGYWLDIDELVPLLASLDPVPVMLVPASLFMAIATFRYQAMDIVPLAQKMAFENVHSAVVVIDPAKNVVATNKYAQTLWPDDDHGRSELEQTIEQLTQGGLKDGAEIELTLASNHRWYLVIISVLENEREGLLGYSLVFVDITDRKLQEIAGKELADARARFFASVSHELRSPLHAIWGLLDLTIDSTLTERQHQQLEDAKASTNMLLMLINDVLEESRFEADETRLEQAPMDISDVTEQLRAVHTYSAAGKGLELRFNIDPSEISVLGDPLRLTQVLTNLVSNAIKFTDFGYISIDIKVLEERDRQLLVEFSVTDTGVGITQENLPKLFKPYHQGDHSSPRTSAGTGLGLSIAKKLVSLMGGDLSVSSQSGSGSTFSFVLDFEAAHQKPKPPPVPIPLPNLSAFRLLVVDDSDINLAIVAAYLEQTGVHWDSASNGELALEQVTKNRYDLVLLDVHMPGMTGLEVVSRIKGTNPNDGVPVIAMSASVLPEDRQLARRAGFDGFLDKPFALEDLLDVLREYLLEDFGPKNSTEPPATPLKVVDSAKGIASMSGDSERFLKLLTALTNESQSQIDALRVCDDPGERHHLLHQMTGAAHLLRADRLAYSATQLNQLNALPPSNSAVVALLDHLQLENDKLRTWIENNR